MVYFPGHRLLYASDTLALNDDGTLYNPELMYEVAQAVKRENLIVDTVFAMHQGPMPWEKVIALIEKSRHSAGSAGPAASRGLDRLQVSRAKFTALQHDHQLTPVVDEMPGALRADAVHDHGVE